MYSTLVSDLCPSVRTCPQISHRLFNRLTMLLLMLGLLLSPSVADRAKVVLVSMDGFRHDYLSRTRLPNFDRLSQQGVRVPYINNTFITNTFPCHYSIATGLYSESHGIVGNSMYDPDLDSFFRKSSKESHWWEGGEPVWITATKAGLKAGIYFWPGSESSIRGVRPQQWFPYNTSVPFEERVRVVVQWMTKEDFQLGVVYFDEPDSSGHAFGPEDSRMIPVLENMDRVLGLLLDGLDAADMKDKVNVIVTSDHGMTSLDFQNKIVDISNYANSSLLLPLVDQGPIAQIRPKPGMQDQLMAALSQINHVKVMLKQDIPERFHLKNNKRVMPIFALADEGWYITDNLAAARQRDNKGGHGYDNSLPSMKPIFLARGPAFKTGVTGAPFQSVDIYPLICHLLSIQPAPNNGSLERTAALLRSSGNWATLSVPPHLMLIVLVVVGVMLVF